MKTQRHIAYLLLVISLLMPMVPVFPHHHHANGLFCVKNDIGSHCCHQHAESQDEGHCCCQTGCVTQHFFQQMPTSVSNGPLPAVSELIPFLSPLLLRLAASRAVASKGDIPIYIESLHGTLVARATGLRAPPSPLS